MKKIITTILVSLALLIFTAVPATAGRGNRGYDRYHDNGRHLHRGWHHSHNYTYHHRHGKKYRYKGHYGSWDRWERYKRHHPNIERRGHYYHEGGHLMFGFTDDFGNSFFFSIGR